ncbi:MAG: hypothetical protein HONBIEJF_01501 [Fimbriimonadaceae bacterium]|nr:hypothetical protein [Fimbriimonadaceae bacterium]
MHTGDTAMPRSRTTTVLIALAIVLILATGAFIAFGRSGAPRHEALGEWLSVAKEGVPLEGFNGFTLSLMPDAITVQSQSGGKAETRFHRSFGPLKVPAPSYDVINASSVRLRGFDRLSRAIMTVSGKETATLKLKDGTVLNLRRVR